MVPIKESKVVRPPFRKKSKKETKKLLGVDCKLKDKRPIARTTQLATKIMNNKISLIDIPDRFMQELLAKVVVDTSIQAGLIEKEMIVSGNGTCFYIGASSRGKRLCSCRENHIYACQCPRNYSDVHASLGWDSH